MRRISKNKARRDAECRPFREQLKREVGHCEICGHDPTRVKWGDIAWRLGVHEIARGPFRDRAQDKPYAVLVVCYRCHTERLSSAAEWPKARQLAALRRSRPEHHDLKAFNSLIDWGPDRISEEDVTAWAEIETRLGTGSN